MIVIDASSKEYIEKLDANLEIHKYIGKYLPKPYIIYRNGNFERKIVKVSYDKDSLRSKKAKLVAEISFTTTEKIHVKRSFFNDVLEPILRNFDSLINKYKISREFGDFVVYVHDDAEYGKMIFLPNHLEN